MGRFLLAGGLFFAGLLLFGSVREAWRLREEQEWATVDGVVDDAKHYEAGGDTWIDLKYHYVVEAKEYSDTSVVDTDGTLRIPDAYREGAEITIHYDPSRPDHSYVQFRGYESPNALAIFGGVVLLICSPFVVYYGMLLYADLMLRKARRHMQAGLEAVSAGQDEIDAMRKRGETVPPELLEREKEIVQQAQESYKQLKAIERQRDSLG